MSNKVTDKIAEVSESVLLTTDFFLVDVEIKGGDVPEVWISVDAGDRDVNMDECAEISNEISFLMDAHDIFSDEYRMNVSSPGLSRPLVDRRQYPKNIGREAEVKYQKDDESHKVKGTLEGISDDKIVIELDDDSTFTVAFDNLIETKIIPSLK